MTSRGWGCVLALLYTFGCGGPQELGKAGTKCYRDDDCAAGLICVAPVGKTARVCSSDATPIVSMVEGPPVAEGGTAGAPAAAGNGSGGAGAPPAAGAPPGGGGGAGASAPAGSGGIAPEAGAQP